MLKIYNTLTNQVEVFKPLEEGKVRFYVCGPTVHDFAHIGNFRTFLFADLLRRYLKFKGYQIHHVMNITDVDDKIIRKSVEAGQSLRDYTQIYTDYFFEDFDALGAERPEEILRATDYIPEMVEIIKRLDANGHTYNSDGSTYFRINTFNGYGKLSKMNFEGNVTGASERVDSDEYEAKENARDFVLWKAVKPGEPSWDTELGQGRPGWHIECSAMSMKSLGETFDIHAGGIDLVFPHHENEIAQSEGATGKPFVKYWVHAEFLMVEGKKMSKSLGNFFTFRDLVEKGFTPRAIRYLLLSAPHHKQLNFTLEGLRGAEGTVARLNDFKQRLSEVQAEEGLTPPIARMAELSLKRFEDAMDDDLNTAEALAAIHDFVRETNAAIAREEIKADDKKILLAAVERLDSVFNIFEKFKQEVRDKDILTINLAAGVNIDQFDSSESFDSDIQNLVDERQMARKSKNFARADEIRDELTGLGILIEDTKDGVRWKRKSFFRDHPTIEVVARVTSYPERYLIFIADKQNKFPYHMDIGMRMNGRALADHLVEENYTHNCQQAQCPDWKEFYD